MNSENDTALYLQELDRMAQREKLKGIWLTQRQIFDEFNIIEGVQDVLQIRLTHGLPNSRDFIESSEVQYIFRAKKVYVAGREAVRLLVRPFIEVTERERSATRYAEAVMVGQTVEGKTAPLGNFTQEQADVMENMRQNLLMEARFGEISDLDLENLSSIANAP
jgi:hypothetical protein